MQTVLYHELLVRSSPGVNSIKKSKSLLLLAIAEYACKASICKN